MKSNSHRVLFITALFVAISMQWLLFDVSYGTTCAWSGTVSKENVGLRLPRGFCDTPFSIVFDKRLPDSGNAFWYQFRVYAAKGYGLNIITPNVLSWYRDDSNPDYTIVVIALPSNMPPRTMVIEIERSDGQHADTTFQYPGSPIGRPLANASAKDANFLYLPLLFKNYPPPPLLLAKNFNGMDDTESSGRYDAAIAVGPTTVVIVKNSRITLRDKSGNFIASKTIADFFAPVMVPGEGYITDPYVMYDPDSGRVFFATSSGIVDPNCQLGSCVAHILLAVSKSSNPAMLDQSNWYLYALDRTLIITPQGSQFTRNTGDYDRLAVAGNALVISMVMETLSNPPIGQGYKVRILDKSVLINGGPVTTWSDLVGPGFEIAANTFGNPGLVFLVAGTSQQSPNPCGIFVSAITNPLASPTLTTQFVSLGNTCPYPPQAVQPGGASTFEAGTGPGIQPVYRNGSLWAAFTVSQTLGSGDVSAIRWVQLDVSQWPNPVTVIQDGTFGSDGIWNYSPAFVVDQSNNMAMVYERSSASEYASAYFTGRLVTDTPSTLRPGAVLKAGTATYTDIQGSRNRYIDFAGAAIDPSDGSAWLIQFYVRSLNSSGMWVGNLNFSSANARPAKP